MQQERFTRITSSIANLAQTLTEESRTPGKYLSKEFIEKILALETLAKDKDANAAAEPLLRSTSFQSHAESLRSVYELYEEFLETKALLDALSGANPLDHDQIKRTFDYARKEAALSGINEKSNVAFVGSGPFPETALALFSATRCSITCIDHHPEAAVLSQALFDRHRLHKLHSLCNDARHIDYSPFSHILIAVLARPKKEILDSIAKTCSKNTRIICRTTEGLRTLIYEPLEDAPLDKVSLIGQITDEKTIISSLIFKPIEVNP